jgi:glycosyltransferase involved in cell wall biosynthesis
MYRLKFWLTVSFVFRLSKLVGCGSQTTAAELRGIVPARTKIVVLPSPVLPVASSVLEQAAASAPLGSPYLLFAGAGDPRKNLTTVLASFFEAGLGPLGVQLAVVGTTRTDLFALEGKVDQNPDVLRLGYVSDLEMIALMSNALAIIYVSSYEGFGRPPIEAMRLGTPVIASDIPVLREVCGEAPIYVQPRNVEQLAAAMRSVAGDAALRLQMVEVGALEAAKWGPERTRRVLLSALSEL